jgi:calcium/proton exchanger cax
VFLLKTHPDYFASATMTEADHGHEGARWSVGRAVGSLVGASALAAYMSEILVGAAEGTGTALGMSEVFIGVVFLAIIGGAAESGSAVAMARKNKLDLTVGIAMGSSIQIALFVARFWCSPAASSPRSRSSSRSAAPRSGRCSSVCSSAPSSPATADRTGTRASSSCWCT